MRSALLRGAVNLFWIGTIYRTDYVNKKEFVIAFYTAWQGAKGFC